ncbi:hypothetical protein [Myceligenerans pegani]|uniref:Holin n=1 Tax=Myceligenerans pegani TaxID=2776917 RepID=A0ABR9MW07_9MICO|nr:hypothetical protein [Myceligenerans sp. TRM 65318]MBE1875048.1 hypothetical protein [Myceligenerans sp. TRM 65318]MBE3017319.1 hypothetical protein [Myceligenerans sp. TRM 65318]
MSEEAAATLAQIIPVFLLALTVDRRLSKPRSRAHDVFVFAVVALLIFTEAGMVALVIEPGHWLGWFAFWVIGLALAATIAPHVAPLAPGLPTAAAFASRTRQKVMAKIVKVARRHAPERTPDHE